MNLQLSLALEPDAHSDNLLRQAWSRSGLKISYEAALQDRTLATCLRCFADAIRKNYGRRRRG